MTGIGQRLKAERTRLKLSQHALGTIGGVETNAQGNYESGVRSPRADYLSRIAQAGIDVTFVVTGLRLPAADIENSVNAPALVNGHGPEQLARLIQSLQGNLHNITNDLFHISRLADSHTDSHKTEERKTQLDMVKRDAESIALATLRLIFVTSRLS